MDFDTKNKGLASLPDDFLHSMEKIDGFDVSSYLCSFSEEAKKGFHVNPFCIPSSLSADDLRGWLTEAFCSSCASHFDISLSPLREISNAFIYETPAQQSGIGYHALHHAGVVYAQDPAALCPVGAFSLSDHFPAEASLKILDLCAAPGGKTSQLAGMTDPHKDLLIANEINPSRNRILVGNMERMGYKNIVITRSEPSRLAERYPGYFDLILVDAPCSGEGMFRKYPESIDQWSQDNVKLCIERQKDILKQAHRMLKDGGILIYSTCTYETGENEDRVRDLCDNYGYHTLALPSALKDYESPILQGCARLYPHTADGEGQFVAYLKKDGTYHPDDLTSLKTVSGVDLKTNNAKKGKKSSVLPEDLIAFWENNIDKEHQYLLARIKRFGDRFFLWPEALNRLPAENITMSGVLVGEIERNGFVPAHQFFSAYGKYFKEQIELSPGDLDLYRYLNGQEIAVPDKQEIKGYAAITVCATPLSGGKISGGRCKNHYPKGLRNTHL